MGDVWSNDRTQKFHLPPPMNSQRHARAFPISHVRVMFKFEVNDKYSLTNHLPCSQPPPIYYPFLYMYIYFLCFTIVGCRRHCHSATTITQLLYMIIIIISSTLLSSLYHHQTIRFNTYLSPTPPIWSPLSLFKKKRIMYSYIFQEYILVYLLISR